jgi:hypothetical protein
MFCPIIFPIASRVARPHVNTITKSRTVPPCMICITRRSDRRYHYCIYLLGAHDFNNLLCDSSSCSSNHPIERCNARGIPNNSAYTHEANTGDWGATRQEGSTLSSCCLGSCGQYLKVSLIPEAWWVQDVANLSLIDD